MALREAFDYGAPIRLVSISNIPKYLTFNVRQNRAIFNSRHHFRKPQNKCLDLVDPRSNKRLHRFVLGNAQQSAGCAIAYFVESRLNLASVLVLRVHFDKLENVRPKK